VACGGLDGLHQHKSFVSGQANETNNATRIDFNPHLYLGKPTAGKKEDKPLVILDFTYIYARIHDPEEHEMESSGGNQVIVRVYKKKSPPLESLSLSQMGNGWEQVSKYSMYY